MWVDGVGYILSEEIWGFDPAWKVVPKKVNSSGLILAELHKPDQTNPDAVVVQVGFVARGDVDCNFSVDFEDIQPFLLALQGRRNYELEYPACDYLLADINGDHKVNFADIDDFVECLIQGGCP